MEKEIIKKLLSLLTDEQKEQDIIEIKDEDLDEGLRSFFSEFPILNVKYQVKESGKFELLKEKNGSIHLWEKHVGNDEWVVKNYQIKRLFGEL
ncbi:hypothetical protein [Nonlabens sp. Asnod3-H03]|uniref:hypothetical protein n=1 Tax=Nonlabens sp. Asnod3-H03 TaxID=3160580 RepID=UPI00386DE43E